MDLTNQTLGPYQIDREIGRGGMAVIYHATDTHTGDALALKVLLPHFVHDPVTLRRFRQEGESAQRLIHPNIVRVFATGESDGTHYIAMEYAAGGTLSDLLKARSHPMTVQEAIPILRYVAASLDYAHNRGILHRDVKPSNILLGDRGQVWLADFGVARHMATDHTVVTLAGYAVGTPAYMAPEQARGDFDLTNAADLYSLGVVAYAMLTHQLPFEAESQLALLRKIIDDVPVVPEHYNQTIPAGISYVLQRMLAKEPERRYATADAFVDALEDGVTRKPTHSEWQALTQPLPRRPIAPPTNHSYQEAASAANKKGQASRRRGRAGLLIGAIALLLVVIIAQLLMPANSGVVNGIRQLLPAMLQVESTPTVLAAAQLPEGVSPTPIVTTTTTVEVASLLTAPLTVTVPVSVAVTAQISATVTDLPTATVIDTATTLPITTPTATALPTETATVIPAPTATTQPSATAIPSAIPSATVPPQTATPLPTATPIPTFTATQAATATVTATADNNATATEQAKIVAAYVAQTLTALPTATVPTATPSQTATQTTLPTATPTASQTATATTQATSTPVPTSTPQPTSTPLPTATETAATTATPALLLTLTAIENQLTALATYLAPPTVAPVAILAATATPVPTSVPTIAPASVPTVAPTATATVAAILSDQETATAALPDPEQAEEAAAGETAVTTTQPLAIGGLQGRIAYSVFNGRSMDIYVYNLADGSRWPHLPNRRQPDLHRSGLYLLANGEGSDTNDVVRITLAGGEQVTTMHPEDAFPQWSPSGQSLAYASTHQGDGKYRIYWQRDASDRTDSPPLAYSGRELFGQYPVYLDNWRIAYQGCNFWAGGSACGIYTADTSGGEPNRATDQTADIPTDSLGSAILFSSNRSGNWDIYRVNWDGSGLTQLTDHPARDGLATASPDFQHIAFVSDREGSWAVYVMQASGSEAQKLFDLNGGYGGGDFEWYRERISWGP